MKLTVKNFGPIAEAKNIEVSPMTIFVGPSNTGKSYLAMLIYSIYMVLAKAKEDYRMARYSMRYMEGNYKDIKDIFNKLTQSQSTALGEIDKYFDKWVEDICSEWRKQFIYCLGEEGRNIIETTEVDKRFSVRISDFENQLILDLTYPEKSKLTNQKKKDIYQSLKKILLSQKQKKQRYGRVVDHNERMYFHLLDECIETLFHHFHTALSNNEENRLSIPHYLPAIRGGIIQSHRTLVSALIERAPMAGLSRLSPIPLFSGVLSDFMQKLINIRGDRTGVMLRRRIIRRKRPLRRPHRPPVEEIKRISGDIENRILSGEIYIQESEVGYPDFRYRFKSNGEEHDLPLMSASSSVSELAPIVLFIRHYLDTSDLFIVEEPEAHLHPAAQRNISDILARLVADGDVNILITTHSDIIVEQVSNFVYAAEIAGSKKTELSKLTKLKEEKCSVYLFAGSRAGKTRVKKVPFDKEYGFLTKDHLDVSSALYNETIRLMKQRDKASG